MGAISVRLPNDLEARLNREAELSARHRSDVIREAIAELVTRRERERYLAAYRAEAKVGYGDSALRAEALAFAEDAIAVDNEALEKAESGAARPNASDETPWWR